MSLTAANRLSLLALPDKRVRAVIDTDTYNEIDDQFALVYALLSPEHVKVEAIYAAPFHNRRSESPRHGMDLSYEEIVRLLERLDISPENLVYRGVREYVGAAKQPREAEAVDDLIARARASTPEDPLYIVAIAAISNVASALLKAPDIVDRVVIVWLGGHALEWPHTREFNLRQDVGGAQALFDSGASVVLLPCMGVVSHLHSTVPEIERYVEPHGRIGAFLAQRYKEYSTDHVGWSKPIWDMAAIAYLISPTWMESVITPAPILTSDVTWSEDKHRNPIRYVRYIDRDPIMKDFFVKLRLFSEKTPP